MHVDPVKMEAGLARLGELGFATLKARWRSAIGRVAPLRANVWAPSISINSPTSMAAVGVTSSA
ncbi:hypothetical protein ACFSCV_16270 [Methylopila henanensis]|uniref:Uncharacterized protein n=1 Tax=Methylopila henanensis TaxID=873516 RepID=A0ABW4KC72_9HYPH